MMKLLASVPFHKPQAESIEIQYLQERRRVLGGYVPRRTVNFTEPWAPADEPFNQLIKGSPHPIATTMALVRLLSTLLHDKKVGRQIVPIST